LTVYVISKASTVNSRLLIKSLGSQNFYVDFQLCRVQGSCTTNLHIVQESTFDVPESHFKFISCTLTYQILPAFFPPKSVIKTPYFPRSSYNLTSLFIYSNINFLLLLLVHLWTYPWWEFLKILLCFLIPGNLNTSNRKLLNKLHSTYPLTSRTWSPAMQWNQISLRANIPNRILPLIFHKDQ